MDYHCSVNCPNLKVKCLECDKVSLYSEDNHNCTSILKELVKKQAQKIEARLRVAKVQNKKIEEQLKEIQTQKVDFEALK